MTTTTTAVTRGAQCAMYARSLARSLHAHVGSLRSRLVESDSARGRSISSASCLDGRINECGLNEHIGQASMDGWMKEATNECRSQMNVNKAHCVPACGAQAPRARARTGTRTISRARISHGRTSRTRAHAHAARRVCSWHVRCRRQAQVRQTVVVG